MDLIERTFQKEGSFYIACNDKNAFLHLIQSEIIIYGLVRKCVKLSPFSQTFYIRFGSKLYVGIPMGTKCAPLVADLFLFCYERDFMLSLSEDNQSDVIEAFNSTSRYLDDQLNIDNNFFVVVLLFYVHGQHLRSCRDGQLT